MRIACWSGPRNLSTALMRSFSSRADCAVVDEPLYASFLVDSGRDHPVRDAVIASQPTDWRAVAGQLTGPIPGGRAHWYQKHMAHHLLPDRYDDWLLELTHVFLVRDPAAMLSSLLKGWPDSDLIGTGLPQQVALLDWLEARGRPKPVLLRAEAVLEDPEGELRRLCDAIGLDWDPAMLSWEAGPHPEDGVWAPHWYASVWRSTGFVKQAPKPIAIPEAKQGLLAECRARMAQLEDRLG